MTYSGGLVELNDLEEEVLALDEVVLVKFLVDLLLLLNMDRALNVSEDIREDIADELVEERLVGHDELGHVHLRQGGRKEVLLRLLHGLERRLTEDGTSETEDGENVSQTEIVMTLLRELFLAKLVQDGELLVEGVELSVTDGGELDLNDRSSIGHHHGDTSEEDFKVLGKLLTTSITGVHRDEVTAGHVESNRLLGVGREDELLQLQFLG